MPVDRHVIGRIREDHVGLLEIAAGPAHQPHIGLFLASVAADEPGAPEGPNVTGARDGIALDLWDMVVLGALGRLIGAAYIKKLIHFGDGEAGQLDVDLLALGHEVFELARKQVLVPAGVLGELVVGQDVGALLRLGERRHPQAGHGLQAEFAGRLDTGVPRQDHVSVVDEHRVREPETTDAFR